MVARVAAVSGCNAALPHRMLAVCLALCGLISARGFSQAQEVRKGLTQYVHSAWRSEQGLPQNSVQAILQSRDGFLWLGTQEGLVRFDGIHFKVFNKSNTPALKQHDIRALFEDRDGNLWVGTFGGGVLKYAAGTFTVYDSSGGLANNFVNAIEEDTEGGLWFGTVDGLSRLDRGQFQNFGRKEGLSGVNINALAVDAEGTLWVGSNHGLERIEAGRVLPPVQALGGDLINALEVDTSGHLWIGTQSAGLYRYANGKLESYGGAKGLPKAPIQALIEDYSGALWLGTNSGGICKLRAERPAQFDCYSQQGLSGASVKAMFEDRERNLWVGTETGGLNRFRTGVVSMLGSEMGVDAAVRSIYEARDGALWFGANTGLYRLQAGNLKRFGTLRGPANNYAQTVTEDRDGNIWVGTLDGGVNEWTKHGLVTYTTTNGLPDNQVHAILQDHAGSLWFGTERGGLARLANGRFTTYGKKDGLPDNRVWVILEDHQNRLWVGTDSGLSLFSNGRFTNYSTAPQPAGQDGIGSVVELREDTDGALWVGTYGAGLKRFKDGKFTTFTTRDGMPDDNIWALLQDDRGNFWMSSNLGIFRIRKQELEDYAANRIPRVSYVRYGTSDGMLSAECDGGAQNSGWKTRDGRLLFSCVRGVVAVDPQQLGKNPFPPPVVIEDATANGSRDLSKAQDIPVGRGELEFHFAGLSYAAPERVQYKYRLEGFDSGWIPSGDRRAAYYTNLPPGKYTFRVVAANNDGIWNPEGASLSFVLEPRFYQTTWFYGLSICSVLFVVMGVYRLRVRQTRKREEELLILVDERTHALQQEVEQRKTAEEALARSAAIVEFSYDGIWSFDANGNIDTWNAAAERMFGYTAAEMIGTSAQCLTPEDRIQDFEPYRDRLLAGECISRLETVRQRKDGSKFDIAISLSPIRKNGQIVGNAVIAQDITERKKADEALRQAKESAEAATRAKSQFLANMSHEIRTPLNGVIGMLELAATTPLTPEQSEFVGMARESAAMLLTVINDILDFSKIEAGKMELDSVDFELADTINEVMRSLAFRAHERGLEVAWRVAPEIPQRLTGDPARLKQVLTNLIGNAIKFTSAGEVTLQVTAEAADGQTELHFAVSDTGIGIEPENQRPIFEAFAQADASMTRRFGGTGLGLAICSRIVSLMGGGMWVESEAGKGSTFHFTASFKVPARQPEPYVLSVTETLPILIVDDNSSSRSFMAELLESWGAKVRSAANGQDALAMMHSALNRGSSFSTVLLDCNLADADAFDIAAGMRRIPGFSSSLIMLLTSNNYYNAALKCRREGIEKFLIKPVHPSELAQLLQGGKSKPAAVAEQKTDTPPPSEKLMILLAEDNLVNQTLASRMLEKAGHTVVIAGNGSEAVTKYREGKFDVVLMDVQMPEMDGITATGMIREQEQDTGRHIPIIAMTAHAMKGDRDRCLAAGMDAYLPKPIMYQQLAGAIEAVIESNMTR